MVDLMNTCDRKRAGITVRGITIDATTTPSHDLLEHTAYRYQSVTIVASAQSTLKDLLRDSPLRLLTKQDGKYTAEADLICSVLAISVFERSEIHQLVVGFRFAVRCQYLPRLYGPPELGWGWVWRWQGHKEHYLCPVRGSNLE